jgi:hypothetical protein
VRPAVSYRRCTDGLGGKERIMGITRTRIAVSVSTSIAVVAAVAGTAGARIPEGESGGSGGTQARPAVVAMPDAVDRAVQRNARTLRAQLEGPDAVARAIARRNR